MRKKLDFLFSASKILSFSFLANLTLISGGWLGLEFLNESSVMAQVSQIPLTLSREPQETYLNFVQRATSLVTTRLKNNFSQNSSPNQVRIVVIGENNGNVAPVLSINMSRQQWLSNPNPKSLINYFPDSQFLLGFDTSAPITPKTQTNPTPSTTNQPTPSPTNTPPTTVSPANSPPPFQDSISPLERSPSPTSGSPNSAPTNSLYNRFRGSMPTQ